jgi:hypothetical protein
MSSKSLADLRAEDFRQQSGAIFLLGARVPGDESGEVAVLSDPLALELVSVTEHLEMVMGSFRTPFAVVFHGPLEPVMEQGTYRLDNYELGTLDLFLVPIGPDTLTQPSEEPSAMQYEAVFA